MANAQKLKIVLCSEIDEIFAAASNVEAVDSEFMVIEEVEDEISGC